MDIEIIDDGEGGTEGNGDGIPQAGERVGLRLMVRNFGNSTESNISITATSADPRVENIQGEVTQESLAPGEPAQLDELLTFDIAPETQHDWILHLNLLFETDADTYEDGYEVRVRAPAYEAFRISTPDVDHGEPGDVTIAIQNRGGDYAEGVSGMLQALSGLFGVTGQPADFGDLAVGEADSAQFTISLNEQAPHGVPARALLILTTENDQVDTVRLAIPLGERQASDVSGPDNYGYYAIENTDNLSNEELVPEFDWIEINPNVPDHDYEGADLGLNDPYENDDVATVVELPFEFQYYGETFTEITVSTNGFIAMGNQADLPNFRNFSIPSPLGPNNMIAPYWDEFRTADTSKVLSYYDPEEGRFIIEWYQMRHSHPSYINTFEVVLYDFGVYPGLANDHAILFQYGRTDHYNPGMSYPIYDIPYWTTGIENGDQTEGLQLAYFNTLSPGVTSIDSGRAILITNALNVSNAVVHGCLTDSVTGEAVVGAVVSALDGYRSTVSDVDGEYVLSDLYTGEVYIAIEAECYTQPEGQSLMLAPEDTVELNFQLREPGYSVSPGTVTDTLEYGESATHQLTVTNDGHARLDYHVELAFEEMTQYTGQEKPQKLLRQAGNELDELWDPLFIFEMTDGDEYHRGVTYDGWQFWATGSNNTDYSGPNLLYRYDNEGRHLATYEQPVDEENRSSVGIRGLCWEGDYLYGADNGVLYQMSTSGDSVRMVNVFDCYVNPARLLVKQPGHDLFWLCDGNGPLTLIDREGEVLEEIAHEDYVYGGTWNPYDPDGYHLYYIALSEDDEVLLYRMHPQTFDIELVTTLGVNVQGDWHVCGSMMTCFWDDQHLVFGMIVRDDNSNRVVLYDAGLYTGWIELGDYVPYVQPGQTATVPFTLINGGLIPGEYTINAVFDHNACSDNPDQIAITLVAPGAGADENTAQPLEWAFDGVWPNPFNPVTRIGFTLKEAADVRMRVFNILGREVCAPVRARMTAGRHVLPFDGGNLASGMYFLRFDAGPLHETRKMVLLK